MQRKSRTGNVWAWNSFSRTTQRLTPSTTSLARSPARNSHMFANSHESQLAIPRRTLLRVGGAGLLGLNLPGLLRAADASKPAGPKVRAKRVIFLFQWGGPSHIDMFDRKDNAPDDIRGPLKSISS